MCWVFPLFGHGDTANPLHFTNEHSKTSHFKNKKVTQSEVAAWTGLDQFSVLYGTAGVDALMTHWPVI